MNILSFLTSLISVPKLKYYQRSVKNVEISNTYGYKLIFFLWLASDIYLNVLVKNNSGKSRTYNTVFFKNKIFGQIWAVFLICDDMNSMSRFSNWRVIMNEWKNEWIGDSYI